MQNKPNLLTARINVTSFITKDYENVHLLGHRKNKAKTKPKQSQFKPKTNPIQTQIKADFGLLPGFSTFKAPNR